MWKYEHNDIFMLFLWQTPNKIILSVSTQTVMQASLFVFWSYERYFSHWCKAITKPIWEIFTGFFNLKHFSHQWNNPISGDFIVVFFLMNGEFFLFSCFEWGLMITNRWHVQFLDSWFWVWQSKSGEFPAINALSLFIPKF